MPYLIRRTFGAISRLDEDHLDWRKANGLVFAAPTDTLSKLPRKDQEKIWLSWAEQEVPIQDTEALLFLTVRKYAGGEPDWRIQSYVQTLTGGVPPVPDFAVRWGGMKEMIDSRRIDRRNRTKKIEPAALKTRLMDRNGEAVKKAFRNAGFVFRYLMSGLYTTTYPETSAYQPRVSVAENKPTRRNKGGSCSIDLTVFSSWWRRVGPERAHMFGPKTFVMHMEQVGMRTRVVLAKQGAKQYQIKVIHGYLMRDAKGNPVFTTT
jgi:hypothetical protein